MAIYGLGAYYLEDVTDGFLTKEVACVGWGKADAPALHSMLAYIKIGDIIYLKSHPAGLGLTIKAVGIVVHDQVLSTGLGECVKVKWIWVGAKELGKIKDKYNVRNNTMYEEHNPVIQKTVVDLLLSRCR
ncbi:MAG: hypothetical protein NWE91_09055 [Candidatus Bathyarchaeota archaeon]|nr:hypothetical protein [Candidatus Bathyarchaeota archaeon]